MNKEVMLVSLYLTCIGAFVALVWLVCWLLVRYYLKASDCIYHKVTVSYSSKPGQEEPKKKITRAVYALRHDFRMAKRDPKNIIWRREKHGLVVVPHVFVGGENEMLGAISEPMLFFPNLSSKTDEFSAKVVISEDGCWAFWNKRIEALTLSKQNAGYRLGKYLSQGWKSRSWCLLGSSLVFLLVAVISLAQPQKVGPDETRIENVTRVLMHEPGNYTLMVEKPGDAMITPVHLNFSMSQNCVDLIKDAPADKAIWATERFDRLTRPGCPALLQIHLHSAQEIDGAGWKRGGKHKEQGQTEVIE
jgi:hypothetical protein